MNIVRNIFIILIFLYTISVVLFAVNGYPLFRQDAICFLPTTYFINYQHQLINPFYDAGIDPIQHRFLFYPPLFSYVLSLIISVLPNVIGEIHLGLTIINICGLIILLRCAYIYIKRNCISYNYMLYAFLGIWVIVLFSFNEIFEGRPEILCSFFIACFLLNNLNKYKLYTNYINGIIVGFNAITSPISTLYLSIITFGILFYFNDFKLKSILQSAAGFFVIFVSFSVFYPYNLVDLFHGLVKHSTNVVVDRANTGVDRLNWIKSIYILTPFHPLIGITFLISIVYLFYILIKKNKISTIICFIFLLLSIYYFAFRNVLMSYNMYVLGYLYMFIILILYVEILNKRILAEYTNSLSFILFFILLFNTIGFFRTGLVFYNTINKVVSIGDLRKDINELNHKLENGKKIYITFSFWPSCLDKSKYIVSNTILGVPKDNPTFQYIVIQQSNTGQIIPPFIPNYTLIKSSFIKDHPMFVNIKIGNTYPYYQAAIYKRNQ